MHNYFDIIFFYYKNKIYVCTILRLKKKIRKIFFSAKFLFLILLNEQQTVIALPSFHIVPSINTSIVIIIMIKETKK